MYKLFDNCRIAEGDEKKPLSGLFSASGLGKNKLKRDFDEVSAGETAVIPEPLWFSANVNPKARAKVMGSKNQK